MNTALDFTAESMRRREETEEQRQMRCDKFLGIARSNWDKLAERIKQKAYWHLNYSDVECGIAESVLGLKEFRKEYWSDIERVIKELAQEHGFEISYQWETLPRRWRFKWPYKPPQEEE